MKKKKKEKNYKYIYIYIFYKNNNNIETVYCCRVTICNLNPDELGYKPNELNTINL